MCREKDKRPEKKTVTTTPFTNLGGVRRYTTPGRSGPILSHFPTKKKTRHLRCHAGSFRTPPQGGGDASQSSCGRHPCAAGKPPQGRRGAHRPNAGGRDGGGGGVCTERERGPRSPGSARRGYRRRGRGRGRAWGRAGGRSGGSWMCGPSWAQRDPRGGMGRETAPRRAPYGKRGTNRKPIHIRAIMEVARKRALLW